MTQARNGVEEILRALTSGLQTTVELAPLLLDEVQQQQQRIAAQNQHSAEQDGEIRRLKRQFEELKALNQATMRRLQDEEDSAVQR